MKLTVDKDSCTGCTLCAQTCPRVFSMQGRVAVVTAETVDNADEASCRDAMGSCPAGAISEISDVS